MKNRGRRWRWAVAVSVTAAGALAGPVTAARAAHVARGRTPVQVWTTTTAAGSDTLALQLAREPDRTFGPKTSQTPRIAVDPSTSYQTIQGFGGAMTDSSAYLIDHSPERAQIMHDLFSPSGPPR